MEVYRVEKGDLHRMENKDLRKEVELEDRLVQADMVELGNVSVLPITRQGDFDDDTRDRLDILGVDTAGNTVIVELKKGVGRRKVLGQALDYASRIGEIDYEYLADRYDGERPLRDAHADQFGLDHPLPESEFNSEQRIVLVGTEFDDRLVTMADYLRDSGIEMVLVEYTAFVDEDEGIELLTTNAITRPREDEPKSRDWLINPKQWHLQEQTNPETADLLEDLIAEFEKIDSVGELDWSQKNYVALKRAGRRMVKFNTKKTQINVSVRVPPHELQQIDTDALASDTGVPPEQVSVDVEKNFLKVKIKPEQGADIHALSKQASEYIE